MMNETQAHHHIFFPILYFFLKQKYDRSVF